MSCARPRCPQSPAAPIIVVPSPSTLFVLQLLGTIRCPEKPQAAHYCWRREYGGLQLEQAKRLKELERENARLRRLVADLALEKQVLKDVAAGNVVQP